MGELPKLLLLEGWVGCYDCKLNRLDFAIMDFRPVARRSFLLKSPVLTEAAAAYRSVFDYASYRDGPGGHRSRPK